MKATIAWWDLTASDQTISSLRQYLKDSGADPWQNIEGLRLKFWISEPEHNLWGAVMIWENETLPQQLPPNKAEKLIGYKPKTKLLFDVDATIEGKYINSCLNKLGLIYEGV